MYLKLRRIEKRNYFPTQLHNFARDIFGGRIRLRTSFRHDILMNSTNFYSKLIGKICSLHQWNLFDGDKLFFFSRQCFLLLTRNFHLDDDDVSQLASAKSLCSAFKSHDRRVSIFSKESRQKKISRFSTLFPGTSKQKSKIEKRICRIEKKSSTPVPPFLFFFFGHFLLYTSLFLRETNYITLFTREGNIL